MRSIFCLCLALVCFATSGEAATFAVSDDENGNRSVSLKGEIVAGDDLKFAPVVENREHVTVYLASNGGDTLAAMAIGRLIRSNKFATNVPSGALCTSACGLIWIAGDQRTLSAGARVGFHGAFRRVNGKRIVSAEGNALVGAYIAEMGYGASAIVYFTQAPPNGVQWLTPDVAKRIGIEYEQIASTGSVALHLMLSPKRWPRLESDWVAPGKGVEIPAEAYTTYRGRSFFVCQADCQSDPMCKAVNFNVDGTCGLLDGSSFGHPNDNVTSWERRD